MIERVTEQADLDTHDHIMKIIDLVEKSDTTQLSESSIEIILSKIEGLIAKYTSDGDVFI
jgi:hypothetical protein